MKPRRLELHGYHHLSHMESAKKVIIVGDKCHDGVVYMPVLHQAMALHSNFISFRAIAYLSHPPAPVYSLTFTPRSMSLRHERFSQPLGYENNACSSLCSQLSLAMRQPNHYLRHSYALIRACDICIRVCEH